MYCKKKKEEKKLLKLGTVLYDSNLEPRRLRQESYHELWGQCGLEGDSVLNKQNNNNNNKTTKRENKNLLEHETQKYISNLDKIWLASSCILKIQLIQFGFCFNVIILQ